MLTYSEPREKNSTIFVRLDLGDKFSYIEIVESGSIAFAGQRDVSRIHSMIVRSH
jgi:hypothetical protein